MKSRSSTCNLQVGSFGSEPNLVIRHVKRDNVDAGFRCHHVVEPGGGEGRVFGVQGKDMEEMSHPAGGVGKGKSRAQSFYSV